MAYNRAELRTRTRDYIYEPTADLISDDQLNRALREELDSLPKKGIYLQDIYEFSSAAEDYDYSLHASTYEPEKLERNDGTSTHPEWVEINGWKWYDSTLYLPFRPSTVDPYRVHYKKKFTILTDDSTNTDVPDDITEVVVAGMVVRAYKMLLGYFRQSKNFDSVTAPGGVTLTTVQNLYRQARQDYMDLLKDYQEPTIAKDINLVS